MTNSTRKIVVALSGGIDSAVSALMLKSLPDSILVGLHMSNWNASDESSGSIYCEQSEKEASDAQLVANFLNIEMKRVEFQREYWHGVFEPFVEGFTEGKTLNPDVGCNQVIKFGAMRDYAVERLGANYIATGHYARLWHGDNHSDQYLGNNSAVTALLERTIGMLPQDEWIFEWGKTRDMRIPLLLAAEDESKDQSYFLSGVNGSYFSNVIFPLGNMRKNNPSRPGEATVRQRAEQFPFGISKKKESMGICFIGRRNFSDFLSEYLPEEAVPGSFVDVETGTIVGKHKGSAFYTVGQGAKISGATCKWFTVEKNKDGTVFVCNDTHHPALYSDELYVNCDEFNWIAGEVPKPLRDINNLPALCRVRHLQPLIPCHVTAVQDKWKIKFDRSVRAIAPGQTAALYVGGGTVCIGGGPISSRGPTYHELGKELIMSSLHPSGINDLSLRHVCRDSNS